MDNTIWIFLILLQSLFFIYIWIKAFKEKNAPATTFALFFGIILPLLLIYQNFLLEY
jgi:hypothetical protein